MDKLKEANDNIRVLINTVIMEQKKSKFRLCVNTSTSKCPGVSCQECTKKYFDAKKEEMLKIYLVK